MTDTDWKKYKKSGPWAFRQSANKAGYVNNPYYTVKPTEKHEPCGYWTDEAYKAKINTWFIRGVRWYGKVVTVGVGCQYATMAAAATAATQSCLYLVYGKHPNLAILNTYSFYIKGMTSDAAISFQINLRYVTNVFLDTITVTSISGAGSDCNVILNKCTIKSIYTLNVGYYPSIYYTNCTILNSQNTPLFSFWYDLVNKISVMKCIVDNYWQDPSDYKAFDVKFLRTYDPIALDGEHHYATISIGGNNIYFPSPFSVCGLTYKGNWGYGSGGTISFSMNLTDWFSPIDFSYFLNHSSTRTFTPTPEARWAKTVGGAASQGIIAIWADTGDEYLVDYGVDYGVELITYKTTDAGYNDFNALWPSSLNQYKWKK